MGHQFLAILLLIFCSQSNAAVWNETQSWSPIMEKKYSEWVRSHWTPDFFARKLLPSGKANPYYGIRADCADTVYSMRIIFSFENKLPFVIQDPTSSSRKISNKMGRWDSESETNRIRNFLWYIYETTSTRSLPNDTYPVQLNRTGIRPGGLLLTTRKNHHSWTIKDILKIGVPYLVYNSVVGANSGYMLKERQSWPNPEWVFEDNYSPSGHAGFRDWRPSEYILRPVWEVPGYSEQQYQIPLKSWAREAQARLAITQETDEELLQRLLKTTCDGFVGRVTVVQEALSYLQEHPECMSYPTYDSYSTPNRDRRTYDDLISLRQAFQSILNENQGRNLSRELLDQLNKVFPRIESSIAVETEYTTAAALNSSSVCIAEYLPQKTMDLAEFKRRLFTGLISNNPNDEGTYRWGDQQGPSTRSRECPAWDPWSPRLTE